MRRTQVDRRTRKVGLLLTGAVMVAVGLLVAPQAFAGPLGGLRGGGGGGGGGGPLAGLLGGGGGGPRGGDGPLGGLRSSNNDNVDAEQGGLAMNGPLARFRNGGALPFPGLGGRNGGGRNNAGDDAGNDAGDNANDNNNDADGDVNADDIPGGLGAGDGGAGDAADGGSGNGDGGNVNAEGCADVHIIATRASTEQPGAGIIGSLVEEVSSQTSQSVSTDATDYPAVLTPYGPSVSEGVQALTEQLQTQAENCPGQQVVLMGYSQGANVIGDVLGGGGGGALGAETPPADSSITDQVSAVILMGDPRHVAGAEFNAGTAQNDGLFARAEDQSLDAFADKTQSYCDEGDLFCASGRSIATHLGYTQKYNEQAADFVLQQIGG